MRIPRILQLQWQGGDHFDAYNLFRRTMIARIIPRIDYTIDPLPYWQFMDARNMDRSGMAEMRYIEGLYLMWDDILKANPGLFIDNCASGGRRIDLEMMKIWE